MHRPGLFALLVIGGYLALVPKMTLAVGSVLDSGPWPTRAHDNQRTNQSSLPGPVAGTTLKLVYDGGSAGIEDLVVTSDGEILLMSCSPQVVAISADGNPLGSPWPYLLMQTAYPGNPEAAVGLTVSADGYVYVSAHECPDVTGAVPAHFYSIQPDGTGAPVPWPIPQAAMHTGGPALGSNGTSYSIYQMDELNVVHAYLPDGTPLWTRGLPGWSNAPIALDSNGYLYIGTDGSRYGGSSSLWSLDPSTGSPRSGFQASGNLAMPVVGPGNRIYVADALTALVYGFDSSGNPLPGFPYSGAGGSLIAGTPLAIGKSGTVYFQTSQGLFAINPDGSEKWRVAAPSGVTTGSWSPVLDINESIYVAFGDSVYSLDPSDGHVRAGNWPVTVPSAGRMVIGGSGLLYVISAEQVLYSISGGTLLQPKASLSPGTLDFSDQGVDTPGLAQSVTLSNTGTATLNISAISVGGTNGSDYAIASIGTTCSTATPVAAGTTCTISVTFKPTGTDVRSGTLSITDNAADRTQTVALTGTGVVAYSLSSDKSSASVIRGTDSMAYTISATTTFGFTGSVGLACTGNGLTTCTFNPTSIAPGQSSTLTVNGLSAISGNAMSFTVTGTSGSQSASVALSIAIADFSLSTSAASATVSAGQSATYNLSVTPLGGFDQQVSLACSGAPPESTCLVSPASVTLDGTNVAKPTVTLTTAGCSLASSRWRPVPPATTWPSAIPLVVLLLMSTALFSVAVTRRRRDRLAVFAVVALFMLFWVACGGGGSSSPPPCTGTAAGTYTLTLTGTYTGSSPSLTHSITVSLTVN